MFLKKMVKGNYLGILTPLLCFSLLEISCKTTLSNSTKLLTDDSAIGECLQGLESGTSDFFTNLNDSEINDKLKQVLPQLLLEGHTIGTENAIAAFGEDFVVKVTKRGMNFDKPLKLEYSGQLLLSLIGANQESPTLPYLHFIYVAMKQQSYCKNLSDVDFVSQDEWQQKNIDRQFVAVKNQLKNATCPFLLGQKNACESMFDDTFLVLSPHGSARNNRSEHGALDRYQALKLYEADPNLEQLLALNRIFIKTQPKESFDLWSAIKQVTGGENANAVRLLSFLTHDNVNYSYISLLEIATLRRHFAKIPVIQYLAATMSQKEMTGYLDNEVFSLDAIKEIGHKRYHFVAGAQTACELIRRGHSKNLSVLSASILGAAYETVDFLCDHAGKMGNPDVSICPFEIQADLNPGTGKLPEKRRLRLPKILSDVGKSAVFVQNVLKRINKKAIPLSDFLQKVKDNHRLDAEAHALGAQWASEICE